MRLIYIHGYVEDPSIFDKIAPLLPADEVVMLDLKHEFARWNPDDRTVNVSALAAYLAKTYAINAADVIIGHSMGGWIAANLKAQTGCGAVQVSSYTDPRKIITFTRNISLLRWLVKVGLVQSKRLARYALGKYPFDQSRELHRALVTNMMTQPKRYIYQQLRVLLAKPAVPPAAPDVRIHARTDNIFKFSR